MDHGFVSQSPFSVGIDDRNYMAFKSANKK
jgi:hypothetical protein